MATRKSFIDSIPDYEAMYNKAYDEVMKEEVNFRKYFSKDQIETMPEIEKIVFVNRLQNYLILKKLGFDIGRPDVLNKKTERQKRIAFQRRTETDETWTPGMERMKTRENTGRGRQTRWPAGYVGMGVSQGKEVTASTSSAVSLCQARKQEPFMGFRRVLARRLLNYLQHELTWKKYLRQSLTNRLIDIDECQVLDPSDELELEKAIKKKKADYRNELRNRYPRRNIPGKNYNELEVPDEDEYILCEECNEEYLRGNCPVHGPVEFVKDKTEEVGHPRKKRKREAGDEEVPWNPASRSIPDGLIIAPSTMPGAGLGVWTKRTYSRGTMFGPYGGVKKYSEKEAHASGYTWEIYKDGELDHYVDAQDASKSNWMRYVNCASSKSVQNVKAFQFSGGIYYRACVDIPVDVEMVVWYGEEYAEELGLVPKQINSLGCPEAEAGIAISPSVRAISRIAEHRPKMTASFVAGHHQTEDRQTGCSSDAVPGGLEDGGEKERQIVEEKKLKRRYSDGKERPHKCSLCIRAFASKCGLFYHMRTHTGEGLHKCSVCRVKFSLRGNLKRHMMIHTGDRPYGCTMCGVKFSQQGNLKLHMSVHTGEKPYTCSVCGVKCIHQGNLNQHMRIHTGEKPYGCTVCGGKFSHQGDLNRHMRVHTGEKPYGCTMCGLKFSFSSQLKRHKGKH